MDDATRKLLEDMFFVGGKPPPGWDPPGNGAKKWPEKSSKPKGEPLSHKPTPAGKPTAKPKHSGPPHKDKGLPSSWYKVKKASIQLLQDKLKTAKNLLKHCITDNCKEMWKKEIENIIFSLNYKLGKSQGNHPSKGEKHYKPSKPVKKWISAGGVVVPSMDKMDFVWIRKPSGNFGPWSFPKGKVDKGESMGQAARREVEEESGIKAKIIQGGYIGQGVGGFSVTHYYLMVQTGGNPAHHDRETAKVWLVHWKDAMRIFRQAHNKRDVEILLKARKKIEKLQKKRPKKKHEALLSPTVQALHEIKPPRLFG